MAYASNARNADTLSIELCHPDDTGKFTDETYAAAVRLTAWLCNAYGITADSIIRHYDVQGKECPRYFVANEDAWEAFKADVAKEMQQN
jgi:N-acetylmuramoyl-L-alanine amidase CwlA